MPLRRIDSGVRVADEWPELSSMFSNSVVSALVTGADAGSANGSTNAAGPAELSSSVPLKSRVT